ncbi:MAG: DUF952 domain-containing protein [Chloroflexota bacterium]|nr:MAG: DUF952 domain-containing protein [Chloroflexota bacterium]
MAGSEGLIVHLLPPPDWDAARNSGEYRASSLESVGFIHFSRPEQIVEVANRYYPDAPDLVMLWVNPTRLRDEVRWAQNADGVFPHLYGPLNLDAVIAAVDFKPDADRVYRSLPKPPET